MVSNENKEGVTDFINERINERILLRKCDSKLFDKIWKKKGVLEI